MWDLFLSSDLANKVFEVWPLDNGYNNDEVLLENEKLVEVKGSGTITLKTFNVKWNILMLYYMLLSQNIIYWVCIILLKMDILLVLITMNTSYMIKKMIIRLHTKLIWRQIKYFLSCEANRALKVGYANDFFITDSME